MIVTMSGGVGSGKTISAVRQACVEAKKNLVLTNFKIFGLKNYYRLRKGDVLVDKTPEENKKKATAKKVLEVNWDFWEEHKHCDIFLDEVHNMINSRNASSVENKKYSEWLSQIRKLWGASGDQNYLEVLRRLNNNVFAKYHQELYSRSNNIFLITQKPRKMDVNFRDLCHVHIQCSKKVIDGNVVIFQQHFLGSDQFSGIDMMEMGEKPKLSMFVANPYFNRYDSYEIVRGEYL